MNDRSIEAKIPKSFVDYLRSMGPGVVVVLTWLGAGDIVESAMAGGNYGYALMWAFSLCLVVRLLFVSLIAKYQLCNQHGESVIGGLSRLHPFFGPFVLVSALLLGHGVGVYLLVGAAQACVALSGRGTIRIWAVLLSAIAFFIAFRPSYRRIEKLFFFLAGVLTASLLGLAAWARPSPVNMMKGIFGLAVPETIGRFDAVFLMVSLIGAVGGGLANLMYAYFIREKGWLTAQHRRVQQYDLIFGIMVLIILDLSVWVVGAEILHPRGIQVVDLDTLALLLGESFGTWGTNLFYVSIFAALFSSIVGNGAAYGYLASDAYLHSRFIAVTASKAEHQKHPFYRFAASWIILSPLVWVLAGKSDFLGITLVINAAQVVLIPLLVAGLWVITASAKYIGSEYKNQWWENTFIALLLILGCIAAYFSVERIIAAIGAQL